MSQTQADFTWKGKNLEEYRIIMDDECDRIIKELYDSDSLDIFRNLLANMENNSSKIPEELPKNIRDFLEENHPPVFTKQDIEKFRVANKVWKKHGIKFIFILFFRSLPYTYMAEKPANVLRMTKLLKKHPDRRIMETAQFVFDVMDDEWWTGKNGGVLSALKVRMLHSAIRYNLLNNPDGEEWNSEWGMPISQEDLIATNQVFSLEFIKGMEIMGTRLNPKEQEAWFHTWKMIGKIMGVQEELLCDTVPEAWELQKSIYRHLFNPKRHHSGIGLGIALVTTMSKFLSEGIVLHLMRNMMKDDEHPDLFYRLFKRDYGRRHPLLFIKDHPSEEMGEKHEHNIQKDHYNKLVWFNRKLTFKRKLEKIGLYIFDILTSTKGYIKRIGKTEKSPEKTVDPPKVQNHLIDLHLDKLSLLLDNHHRHIIKSDNLNKENKFRFKTDVKDALSGIVMGLLAKHFRPNKITHKRSTRFRIPASIKENWSIPH